MARNSQEGLEVVQHEPYPVQQNPQDSYAAKYQPEQPEPSYYAPTYDEKLRLDAPTRPVWYRRKLFIALLGLIVVLAVVGGVVAATRSHHSAAAAPPAPAQSDLPSTVTNVPAGSSAPGPLPSAAGQTSVCHGGVCPRVVSSFSWGANSSSFVFALSSTKSLVYKALNGTTWDREWTDIGGSFLFPPTVLSWGPGRIDALGVQADRALHWRSFSGGAWNPWWSLGGGWSTAVSAVSRAPGRIDAFGVGLDGGLWHAAGGPTEGGAGPVDETTWAALEGLGGGVLGAPSVASWGPDRLDVFVRGTDNTLSQMWWDGAWHAWSALGGVLTAEPVVVAAQSNQLDIFVLGTQGAFCWLGWRGAWLPWSCPSNGTTFESVPAPFVAGPNRTDVVVVAGNDHAYHKALVGTTWSPAWDDLGGPLNGAPQVASFAAGDASVVGLGLDSQMYAANWSTAAPAWTGNMSWISLGGKFETVA
jgi:hypothetical protein